MIYFIITCCIIDNCDIRKQQYINGINILKDIIKSINNYKIIIVENNGLRNTYLDNLDCIINYTTNNSLLTNNKGYKELKDIFDCIEKYNIYDNDFIVKMTGRYILDINSEFINIVKNMNIDNNFNYSYDCIIKYGPYFDPVDYKMNDCITGLIGIKCYFIKKIIFPTEYEAVEWNWAKCTYLINDEKIHKVKKLGINICPGSNNYFLV
jgi:hypothetical protein